jgi:cytochrome c2
VKDFSYSPGVKASAIIWSADTLDRWLTDPQLRADATAY